MTLRLCRGVAVVWRWNVMEGGHVRIWSTGLGLAQCGDSCYDWRRQSFGCAVVVKRFCVRRPVRHWLGAAGWEATHLRQCLNGQNAALAGWCNWRW